MSASQAEQPDYDWIHSYPFTLDPAQPPPQPNSVPAMPGVSSAQPWRPSLGLNTYDFNFDDSTTYSNKFVTPQSGWARYSAPALSPPSSLFPSVSSVQSSPHTSPASVDPNARTEPTADLAFAFGGVVPRDQLQPAATMSTHPLAKRLRGDFECQQINQTQQQGPPRNVKLDEENRYLVYLRDQQRLPWKEISRKFEQTFQRPFQAPALQMRYGRLKNRLHPWTDADTAALQMAQEYYANKRFEIIAEKMLEFGATDAWAPRVCARKLRQLEKEGNAGLASPTMSNSSEEPQQQQQQLPDSQRSVDEPDQRGSSPQLPGGPSWSAP